MMQRSPMLGKYLFDWDFLNVVINGKSALDTRFFSHGLSNERVLNFLRGYGFDPQDSVTKAELYGNFQEANQFIKRYFLKREIPTGSTLRFPIKF